MKALFVILPVVLLLTGCGSDESAEVKTTAQDTPTYVSDEPIFLEASKNLVEGFGRDLRSELMAALNAYGPPYALQVCQIKAPEIAAAHTKGGWSIKRVSEKYRNPDDRPINDEATILAKFADPNFHQDYYQDWYGTDSNRVFRYCQKIVTQPMCLQCHGDLQTMDSDLYKQVKLTYPWDKATGHKAGDLRGMFVVEASWPAGKDLANLLASGVDITSLDTETSESKSISRDSTAVEDTITEGNW